MSDLRLVRFLTRKDKKAKVILKEGMLKWWPNLRFLTLTGIGDFKKNFRQLKRWLTATFRESWQYFAVRTAEGQAGVVHMVVASSRGVRYGDLSAKWAEISGSWVVSIRKVKTLDGMLEEMTRQKKVVRYFRSKGWLGITTKQLSLVTGTEEFPQYTGELYRMNSGNHKGYFQLL